MWFCVTSHHASVTYVTYHDVTLEINPFSGDFLAKITPNLNPFFPFPLNTDGRLCYHNNHTGPFGLLALPTCLGAAAHRTLCALGRVGGGGTSVKVSPAGHMGR